MWKALSKSEAEKIFNSWNEKELPEPSCSEDYNELRRVLVDKFREIKNSLEESNKNKKDYILDVRFGLELYDLLWQYYDFNSRDASDDGVWIYLSIKVIPDLVYKRQGMKADRFYKQSNRIWLKTLWWYIHLSWNGSKESTYYILKDFTTDGIAQLVERSGPFGYRIALTREIMKQFGELDQANNKSDLFRKAMKLNTARVKLIEPELVEGGTENYVKELIEYFYENYELSR